METMPRPDDHDDYRPKEYCCECGYVGHCPHMDSQQSNLVFNPVTNTVTKEAKPPIVDLFSADMVYDSSMCKSYDHKSAPMQMQGIHFAMMRYFGIHDGQSDSMLNYNWLDARRKEFPGR